MLLTWMSLMLLPGPELPPVLHPSLPHIPEVSAWASLFLLAVFLVPKPPLAGPLCLLSHPDQPELHHPLTSLDMSADSKRHEALGNVFFTLLSQGPGACLAHDAA